MQYIKLLEQLAIMICPSEQEAAVTFVNKLLTLMKTDIYNDEDPELLFIFGLITDLYSYSVRTQGQKISLSTFAQRFMGLVILHAKSTDEYAIYCSDFLNILRNKIIYKSLRVSKEQSELSRAYLDGVKVHPDLLPSSKIKSVNDYIANVQKVAEIAQNNILKRFEAQTFKDLNYSVKLDLDNLVMVLNILLNRVENPYPILQNLYNLALPLKNKEQIFDALISALDKEIKKFELTQQLSKNTDPNISLASINFDSDDEEQPLLPQEKETPRMEVNLILIPQLEMPPLSFSSALSNYICKKLTKYTEPLSSAFSFFLGDQRRYTTQVKQILFQIDDGEHLEIENILEQLKDIKITNQQDDLVGIISSIEKKFKAELHSTHGRAL